MFFHALSFQNRVKNGETLFSCNVFHLVVWVIEIHVKSATKFFGIVYKMVADYRDEATDDNSKLKLFLLLVSTVIGASSE